MTTTTFGNWFRLLSTLRLIVTLPVDRVQKWDNNLRTAENRKENMGREVVFVWYIITLFEVKVVKKGYLHKRGEYVKTWRKRYFILFSDGDFSGFRTMESVEAESGEKQNNFTVEGCQIIKKNRPKPFTFIIRGLQVSFRILSWESWTNKFLACLTTWKVITMGIFLSADFCGGAHVQRWLRARAAIVDRGDRGGERGERWTLSVFPDSSVDAVLGAGSHFCWGVSGKKWKPSSRLWTPKGPMTFIICSFSLNSGKNNQDTCSGSWARHIWKGCSLQREEKSGSLRSPIAFSAVC